MDRFWIGFFRAIIPSSLFYRTQKVACTFGENGYLEQSLNTCFVLEILHDVTIYVYGMPLFQVPYISHYDNLNVDHRYCMSIQLVFMVHVL
jgi:hypothetical protein